MSVQEESPVTWDVDGWVKAALRNWANRHEEIQIVGHSAEGGERWIEILVHHRRIATILVERA